MPCRVNGSRIGAWNVAIATLAAFGAIVALFAASAHAAPIFTGSFPNTFTIKAKEGIKFNTSRTGEVVTSCKEVSGTGSLTGPDNGTFKGELTGCSYGGLYNFCEGQGKPKFEGSLELVQINTTTVGVVLLPNELVFHCKLKEEEGSLEKTTQYKGAILAPISPINTSTTHFTLNLNASSKGFPEYTSCEVGAQCGKSLRLEGKLSTEEVWWPASAEKTTLELTTGTATKIVK